MSNWPGLFLDAIDAVATINKHHSIMADGDFSCDLIASIKWA